MTMFNRDAAAREAVHASRWGDVLRSRPHHYLHVYEDGREERLPSPPDVPHLTIWTRGRWEITATRFIWVPEGDTLCRRPVAPRGSGWKPDHESDDATYWCRRRKRGGGR